MNEDSKSIFQVYYETPPFVDRYVANSEGAVDVIIPVIHTNELWRVNLLSLYREIPIHALLIGDGGCIDNSIEIAREFPRVKVLDHRNYKSLGYSVRKLMESVETEWFIYVHSDVYLPPGWFDVMCNHKGEYDWFGCPMQHTVMIDYNLDYEGRPWAGSQMGRKQAFLAGLGRIDDDYVYRQEDFVFSDIVRKAGGKEGKVSDTLHYHQTIRKDSPWSRKVTGVHLDLEISREEEVRTALTQVKGLVKYLDPNVDYVKGILINVNRLQEMGELTWQDFKKWVEETNPSWLPLIIEEVKKADSSWLPLIVEEVKKINEAKKNESKKFTSRLAQKLCKLINKALGVG